MGIIIPREKESHAGQIICKAAGMEASLLQVGQQPAPNAHQFRSTMGTNYQDIRWLLILSQTFSSALYFSAFATPKAPLLHHMTIASATSRV